MRNYKGIEEAARLANVFMASKVFLNTETLELFTIESSKCSKNLETDIIKQILDTEDKDGRFEFEDLFWKCEVLLDEIEGTEE